MRRLMMVLLLAIVAAFAAADDLAGRYAGEWKSGGSGNAGQIRFKLASAPGGGWTCDLTFGLDGSDVKTTMREVKVEGSKLELAYDFDLQGNALRSRVRGGWDGSAFKGTFQTALVDGSAEVDGGTWTATREK